jgi:hypothetical protein
MKNCARCIFSLLCSRTFEREVGDATSAVGRAIDAQVVHQHAPIVARDLQIELDRRRAVLARQCETDERILGRVRGAAAVRCERPAPVAVRGRRGGVEKQRGAGVRCGQPENDKECDARSVKEQLCNGSGEGERADQRAERGARSRGQRCWRRQSKAAGSRCRHGGFLSGFFCCNKRIVEAGRLGRRGGAVRDSGVWRHGAGCGRSVRQKTARAGSVSQKCMTRSAAARRAASQSEQFVNGHYINALEFVLWQGATVKSSLALPQPAAVALTVVTKSKKHNDGLLLR